jgi:hypothetical protein
MKKIAKLVLFSILLTSCADPTITFKSITIFKSALDGSLTLNGEKNTTDIGVSAVTGYDCKTARAIKEENIKFYCVEVMPENLTKELK